MAIAANGSKSTAEKPGRFRIPLWLKFAAVMVALVALLLLAGGAISLWWGYNEAQRSALAEQQKKAETLAGRIGGVMADLERQLTWTAQPAWKNAGVEQQRADFSPHAAAVSGRYRTFLHRRQRHRAAQSIALRSRFHSQPDEPRRRAALRRDREGADVVRPRLCP